MTHKIFVFDEDVAVLQILATQLSADGLAVIPILDTETGLSRVRSERPSLIILDLMFAGMSGLEICKELKSDPGTRYIPIILLTAKADVMDKIVGLELGADDYVTKPFNARELLLRINRSLRRGEKAEDEAETLTLGELTLNHARHEVRVGHTIVRTTSIEFKLLALLLERIGRVQSRERLLNDVWGYESAIDSRTVDTHVKRLREKLGSAGRYLETVRGVGYRIAEASERPVEAIPAA